MHKLEYYSRYKNTFNYETYLDTLDRDPLRISLSQFRLCSHKLEIEFGRFSNIARELRLCKLCNMRDVETEYHFLLICPTFSHLRIKYLGNLNG